MPVPVEAEADAVRSSNTYKADGRALRVTCGRGVVTVHQSLRHRAYTTPSVRAIEKLHSRFTPTRFRFRESYDPLARMRAHAPACSIYIYMGSM